MPALSFFSGSASKKGPRLCKEQKVPSFARDLYITDEYRQDYTFTESLWSLFSMHNETVNIWTHLMGFVVSFLVLLAFVGFPSLFNADNTAEHARAAMQIFLCGTSILYFCSSLAHTLSCNWKYRHSIWMIDYLGIGVYGGTSCVAQTLLSSPSYLRENATISASLILIGMTMGVCCFIIAALSRFWGPWRYAARFIIFGTLFVSSHIADSIRVFNAPLAPDNIFWTTHYVSLFIGGVVNASKLPESLNPSRIFNLYLNSHIIWHLFSLIGGLSQMVALFKDLVSNDIPHGELFSSASLWALFISMTIALLTFYGAIYKRGVASKAMLSQF
eukprot:TRINITY_DN9428_c0_g1_i1.p1 TRINITY_DN9428_c0_g1~~TRINITY_DN9428_c0_g1_i1.p1  ORF type:complete len:331 (-),score=-0.79 TRINITY_DN9428_c0_g1_i1:57-1049(-)